MSRVDSHRPGLVYARFCASADEMRCFGTQIRIRRSSGIVPDNFKAVSPQSAVARVKFHGVVLSVISAHAPHEFRTLLVKKHLLGSLCAQPPYLLRLLMTELPFSVTSVPV